RDECDARRGVGARGERSVGSVDGRRSADRRPAHRLLRRPRSASRVVQLVAHGGVGLDGRAPFTDVLTHGWVLDAEGRAMHKSLGNVIAPDAIIQRYGADIVRWWALATDWRNDVRIGDEILQRVADAYRKVRNTFRFLLGNLYDFGREQALPFE